MAKVLERLLLGLALTLTVSNESWAQVQQFGNREMQIQIDEYTHRVPFYSTHSLSEEHRGVTQLVIVVHGTNRNVEDYFDNMRLALDRRPGKVESTAILAPQFLVEDDIASYSLDQSYPYWSVNGWASGSLSRDEAAHPRSHRVSSFELLDSMILEYAEILPDLEYVICTGHSAGGRLTNRYTASSPIFDLLCDQGVASKSIIANANTFVYMSDKRRIGDQEDQFESFDDNCDGFNDWSFGLEDLFDYPARMGAERIVESYGRREVVYLLGEEDNDPDDLNITCQGAAQGDHRLQRGKIYFNHVLDHFGTSVNGFHRMSIVPGVGHDHAEMYRSEEGVKALFDDKPISSCNTITNVNELRPTAFTYYPNPARSDIYFEWEKNEGHLLILKILNEMGQIVMTQIFDSSGVINVSHLTSGLYFIQVTSGRQSMIEKLIIL